MTVPMSVRLGAIFGGAAVGLLVGVILRYALGADDLNVFAFLPIGIIFGLVGLAMYRRSLATRTPVESDQTTAQRRVTGQVVTFVMTDR